MGKCPHCDKPLLISENLNNEDCPYCGNTLWVCPRCGEYLDEDPDDLDECPHCNKTLKIIECPECNRNIPADSAQCPDCDAVFEMGKCPDDDCGKEFLVDDGISECPYCNTDVKVVICPHCGKKHYVQNEN